MLAKRIILSFLCLLTVFYPVKAGKKALIWDDTETLGTSNSQNENYFFYTKNLSEIDGSYIFNFTYGYNDKTDIAMNIPFGYLKSFENTYSDMGDPFFEVKYRFYEKNSLKLAIKPFVGIPVKRESNFSESHFSYALTLVSQLNFDRFTLYGNSTYMVHKEKVEENEIFQSLSIDCRLNSNFNLVSSLYLSYYEELRKGGLIGISYSWRKLEMAIGIGKVFSSDNDYSLYGGVTFRFF
ncbi:MAG: transporter [Hydrogenothermaceae bacterium]|nr:transporter [Hydrogenothermaceae bacterium]